MADVGQITYTHANGNSVDLFPLKKTGRIRYISPGKEISRQPNKVGIVVDPNKGFRVVTCSVKLETADLAKLKGYMLPAVKPTYDDTYPNVTVKIDGTNTETILCVLMDVDQRHWSDNKWRVDLLWEERSAP